MFASSGTNLKKCRQSRSKFGQSLDEFGCRRAKISRKMFHGVFFDYVRNLFGASVLGPMRRRGSVEVTLAFRRCLGRPPQELCSRELSGFMLAGVFNKCPMSKLQSVCGVEVAPTLVKRTPNLVSDGRNDLGPNSAASVPISTEIGLVSPKFGR